MKAPVLAAMACLGVPGFADNARAQTHHDHGAPPAVTAPSSGDVRDPDSPAPFGSPTMDQHVFYHLMLNSKVGDEIVLRTILHEVAVL